MFSLLTKRPNLHLFCLISSKEKAWISSHGFEWSDHTAVIVFSYVISIVMLVLASCFLPALYCKHRGEEENELLQIIIARMFKVDICMLVLWIALTITGVYALAQAVNVSQQKLDFAYHLYREDEKRLEQGDVVEPAVYDLAIYEQSMVNWYMCESTSCPCDQRANQ